MMSSSFGVVLAVALIGIYWAILPESPPLDYQELVQAGNKLYGLGDSISQTPLEGRTVVITGSTSGIGKSTVSYCCKLGATVVAMGRNSKKLRALKEEHFPCQIHSIVADHADLHSVSKAADTILTKFGSSSSGIDILVNNAGIHTKFEGMWKHEVTPQGYDLAFGVNYLSHFLLTDKLLPLLQQSSKGGRVAQISSLYHATVNGDDLSTTKSGMIAAQKGGAPGHLLWRSSRSYSNSKLAQILHARWLQRNTENITAVSVCPAWVATNISGTHDMLLHDGFEKFAFDADGFGVSSVMLAIVGASASDHSMEDTDFYINTLLAEAVLHHPIFTWIQQFPLLLDIIGSAFAAYLFFGQRWAPVRGTGVSSPPSYNETLQDELIEWSKDAISKLYL